MAFLLVGPVQSVLGVSVEPLGEQLESPSMIFEGGLTDIEVGGESTDFSVEPPESCELDGSDCASSSSSESVPSSSSMASSSHVRTGGGGRPIAPVSSVRGQSSASSTSSSSASSIDQPEDQEPSFNRDDDDTSQDAEDAGGIADTDQSDNESGEPENENQDEELRGAAAVQPEDRPLLGSLLSTPGGDFEDILAVLTAVEALIATRLAMIYYVDAAVSAIPAFQAGQSVSALGAIAMRPGAISVQALVPFIGFRRKKRRVSDERVFT